MKEKRKCIVCHKRPVAVPDRNQMGRPIKRVCCECHLARLQGDIKLIDALERISIKQVDREGNEI